MAANHERRAPDYDGPAGGILPRRYHDRPRSAAEELGNENAESCGRWLCARVASMLWCIRFPESLNCTPILLALDARTYMHILNIHAYRLKTTGVRPLLPIAPVCALCKQAPPEKDKHRVQYCRRCEAFKPPRSHHCRHCDAYVERVYIIDRYLYMCIIHRLLQSSLVCTS